MLIYSQLRYTPNFTSRPSLKMGNMLFKSYLQHILFTLLGILLTPLKAIFYSFQSIENRDNACFIKVLAIYYILKGLRENTKSL